MRYLIFQVEESESDNSEESSDDAEEELEQPKKIIKKAVYKNQSDDEDETSQESSEVEVQQPKGKKRTVKEDNTKTAKKPKPELKVTDLEKNDILKKNQKRYVVFVGNIPYDTTPQDLRAHFSQKVGNIKHIRVPTEKKTNKPRGFAYVEVENEESYQKCLSMHHSILNSRRINVMYTEGGKKKGEDQKKKIKAKNFKLHAMRKQGQLAGSTRQTQKRAFRRAKKNKPQGEDA